jgi:hypothetical protein
MESLQPQETVAWAQRGPFRTLQKLVQRIHGSLARIFRRKFDSCSLGQ